MQTYREELVFYKLFHDKLQELTKLAQHEKTVKFLNILKATVLDSNLFPLCQQSLR